MDATAITDLHGRQLVPGWEARILSHREPGEPLPADEVEVYQAVRLLLGLPDDDLTAHVLASLLIAQPDLGPDCWLIPLSAQELARLLRTGTGQTRWVCAGCTVWVDANGQFEQ